MRGALWVAIVCAGGAALAKRPPAKGKVLLELTTVQAAPSAPAEVIVKARTVFAELASARPEIVAALDGAPDVKADPTAYRRWLDARGIRAFTVELKIEPYERSLVPNDKPGRSGQLLTIKLGVTLLGAQIPGNQLALAGSGGSTVIAEVGATLRGREEEGAMDDALKDALGHALDDAIAKLSAPAAKKK